MAGGSYFPFLNSGCKAGFGYRRRTFKGWDHERCKKGRAAMMFPDYRSESGSLWSSQHLYHPTAISGGSGSGRLASCNFLCHDRFVDSDLEYGVQRTLWLAFPAHMHMEEELVKCRKAFPALGTIFLQLLVIRRAVNSYQKHVNLWSLPVSGWAAEALKVELVTA
uniref:Uncharacterized protein n=1 Tax=Coccidioides posadasii RMSCC 3488 TaxID=454284 RepID=A0A0J6FAY9_COCPO|nr:hypothetical protein CPAG_06483 [Coccidioides posadasii RMSCC 3488]